MTRRMFRLLSREIRENAAEACLAADEGDFVIIRPPTRTLDQNAKFHALCGDLEKSGLEWGGKRRTLAQWKVLLVSGHAMATKGEADIVEGLEGELVNLRESTADMDRARGSSLIEYAVAFCAMQGVGS